MVISVASYKGGVGKTTTAIHLAAYFQALAPTLLLDGDLNRSALRWAEPGKLPFQVVDHRQAAMHIHRYQHVVVDTQARPDTRDMKVLAGSCDLLVLPCSPDAISLQVLGDTVDALKTIGAQNYRILLTIVPPRPNRDGEEARQYLAGSGLPVFAGGTGVWSRSSGPLSRASPLPRSTGKTWAGPITPAPATRSPRCIAL